MEREIATGVLAIQRCMAQASPRSWRDGIVVHLADGTLELALLDGSTALGPVVRLHVIGSDLALRAGEPVAWHPVAEILSAGQEAATARIAA